MYRSNEDTYRSLGEAVAGVALAGLAFCLWLLAGCSRIVIRSYTRWGHTRLLRLAAVLYGLAMVLAISLMFLGANVLAGCIGLIATAVFIGAAWVFDAIYQERANQQVQDENLQDVLDGGWWQ